MPDSSPFSSIGIAHLIGSSMRSDPRDLRFGSVSTLPKIGGASVELGSLGRSGHELYAVPLTDLRHLRQILRHADNLSIYILEESG